MRIDTVLKRVELAIDHLEKGEIVKAYRTLKDTRKNIKEAIEKKKQKNREPQVRELIAWYLELWDNKPPEIYGYNEPLKVIGRHLKDLLRIYRNNNLDAEDLKYEYSCFKDANPKLLDRKRRTLLNRGKGDRGIVHFRYVLPLWKENQNQGKKEWTTPENERGLDYYTEKIEF